MDPLSISAGAVAFIGAAIDIARKIESLKGVRKLPEEFGTLLEEVSDLQHQLEQCKAHVGKHTARLDSLLHASSFVELSRVAKDKLEHLAHELPASTARDGLDRMQKLKLYWTGVVDGKSRLRRSRDELRDIRLGLVQSLATLTAPLVCGIDQRIDDLAEAQVGLQATQNQVLKTVLALTHQARAASLQQPPSYEASVTETTSLSVAWSPGLSNMTRRKPTTVAKAKANANATSTISNVRLPPDRFSKFCLPWCSCTCHTPTYMSSIDALRDIFGCLTISHSGVPGLTKACNESRCRRRMSPKVNVRYRLPRAIASFQYLTCSFSTLAGVELRVKLPRIIDWTSPVWHYATAGNFEAVANLFRNGLASPWDVSPVGGNLLHYATDHWNADLCKLLMDADLDPEAEDDFKSTAVCIAWERVLSGKMSPEDACTVASIFQDTDYLASRSFTIIHKIVLGLISKDLDFELQCSTANINTQDSRGRTPLSWAAARGDEQACRILLEHKADPGIADVQGHQPLHYVQNTACAELLLESRADLNALNGEKQTPLYTACRNIQSASLTKFLIEAGSDVNAVDQSNQTPLHTANGKFLPFINVLLNHGADINIRNNSGDTPLRFAIIFNWHHVLRKMLRDRPEADFGVNNDYGQSFAHAIARTADVGTVRILTAARPRSLRPDLTLRDSAGKTAEQYFDERVEFLEDDEEGELREAFAALMAALRLDEDDSINAQGDATRTLDSEGKVNVVLVVEELSDDLDDPAEIFHDAVEAV